MFPMFLSGSKESLVFTSKGDGLFSFFSVPLSFELDWLINPKADPPAAPSDAKESPASATGGAGGGGTAG